MKVLVIDDCEITLESVRVFLETEIPGVDVTEYWSSRLGKPGPDFDWTAHDVLLLRIVNLTDLRAFVGHAGGSKSLIVSFGTCSFHDKYEKFCVKLTVPFDMLRRIVPAALHAGR